MSNSELPPCRWRYEIPWAGRVGCKSALMDVGPFGVMRHQCGMCQIADHLDQAQAAPREESAGQVRHLLYFMFPVGYWLWHVEQLRRYMPLFNGERHLCVALGPETASLDEVVRAVYGLQVKLHPVRNDPVKKEFAGYPLLVEQLKDRRGKRDVHFYAHAKGVVSQDRVGPAAIRWAEAMYEALLGHWPAVRRELQTHACVGIFRRLWAGPGPTLARWHYSGTFRWSRNADFYARDWRRVDQHWLGAETHPGVVFGKGESSCLYGEFSTHDIGLYADSEWERWAEPQRRAWLKVNQQHREEPMLATVILTSCRQPELVHEAIASVQSQTTDAWELIVMDAGPLADAGTFDRYKHDARIVVEKTGETADHPKDKGRQAWAINECVRRGLVRGDIVCCLSDDDWYAPEWLASVMTAARSHPEQAAWCGWAHRMEYKEDRKPIHLGKLQPGGVGEPGYSLRCRVDGMQVACRRSVWQAWPEEVELSDQADGYWMEYLAEVALIHPLAVCCGVHRHTPNSTFTRPRKGVRS